ncbi:DNA helicase RecQ [Megamonas funiformis]|uniref:DNA helicase RecQ n=1 Tax=Megamonas funiformis TaxID=437897 RepID=UPI001CD4B11A|nr:DNA helicase RecQ [Megamonas funiformis]UBS48053.1 DNA helicase RecQ [Megamonas funiformis]GLU99000.1 ATP-dependent DNA helicase RecQ [Megamonas funiformis]
MLNKARQILQKFYGYEDFRPGQKKVVESLLNKNDTVAIMPTGAGKSICFQIPALLFEGVTLVISPLISLMKDQVDSLRQLGIAAVYINSSVSKAQLYKDLQDISAGFYKIIYIAPERLTSEYLPDSFKNLNISMVAVDEAHCLSQWGHDFRPSYRNILNFTNSLRIKPIISAFTATATPEVKTDIINLLGLKQPNVFVTGFDRPNLYFSVLRGEVKDKFVIDYVKKHQDEAGIIYVGTRKDVDALQVLLEIKGIKAGRYHAGMTDEERNQMQEDFLYDNLSVMVATNAFGMGIDKPNVRYVIHYNMPKNMEAYYQEAGRAGRDGLSGNCILLYSPQDTQLQKFLISKSTESEIRQQLEYKRLQSMVDYCHTPQCLRAFILHYFGEFDVEEHCDNCSNCKLEGELIDITIDAQKVLSCVYRMHERFGVKMIAEVLKGSKSAKVKQFNFERLSTYGLMKERKLKDISDLILRLSAMQYLDITESQYPVVTLNELSWQVLRGQKKVWQKMVIVKKAKAKGELFEALRSLRKELATKEKLPPYMIFSDATLTQMATDKPTDLELMKNIRGVGEFKLQKYGEEFLTVIKSYIS